MQNITLQTISECHPRSPHLLKLELKLPKASGLCLPPIKPVKSTLSLLTCRAPCVWLNADSGLACGATCGAAWTGAALWNGFEWPENDNALEAAGAAGAADVNASAPAPV